MPVGAEVGSTGEGVHFRVWAPDAKSVDVVLTAEKISTPLTRESGGYYSGLVPQASAGSLYRYRLDGGEAFPVPLRVFSPKARTVHRRSSIRTISNGPTRTGQV